MKHICKALVGLLLCVLLVACAVCGLAQGETGVYWQLEEIAVSSYAATPYGVAYATTNQASALLTDPVEMMDFIRGERTISMGLDRTTTGSRTDATYTISGFPVLVPGAAYARLSVTADTDADEGSYYLYCTVDAARERVSRLRGDAASVVRVRFSRKAVPGESRTIVIRGRELNTLADVTLTYTYCAHAGTMLIDPQGDIVIYDEDGNETLRVAQSVADILPDLVGGSEDAQEIFSAYAQEDGSLIVSLSPNSGMTAEEIIRLLRAAMRSASKVDAQSAATFVSTLSADDTNATLYFAPGSQPSDDVLRVLIAAATGKSIDTGAMQRALASGEATLAAAATATPAPLSYAQLRALINQTPDPAQAEPVDSFTAADNEAAQAVVLYDPSGISAVVLTPNAQADGNSLLSLIAKMEDAVLLKQNYQGPDDIEDVALNLVDEATSTFGVIAENAGDASIFTSPLEDSTLIRVQPGSIDGLIAQLDDKLILLRATPTPAPTATPTVEPTATPTAEPTATPTAEPTATPTVEPTATPTVEPTATPTVEPTATPTVEPTATPTVEPTVAPTATPTAEPTVAPTATPTAEPTVAPTVTPTAEPTVAPTAEPTAAAAMSVAVEEAESTVPAQTSAPSPVFLTVILALLILLLILLIAGIIIVIIRNERKD